MAVTISGSGTIDVGGTSTSQGTVRLYEDTDNGTNYVELVAPASVASNVTLTMPTTTGTVATVAGSTTQVQYNSSGSLAGSANLTFDGTTLTVASRGIAKGGMPGSILQVVSSTKTDTTSSATGSTYADTGVSASITPTSSTSKILIAYYIQLSTNSDVFLLTQLVRGSTAICVADTAGSRATSSSGFYLNSALQLNSLFPVAVLYLDSPATTSSTTYKVQARMNSSGTFYVNRSSSDADAASAIRGTSGIVLMEVAV